MKTKLYLLVVFLIAVVGVTAKADEKKVIRIETDNISLIYGTNNDGRLYQTYLGQNSVK
ncbi:hypothetical protein EZS27_015972 [termite gut metagenome]|uniref:Alpha-galactosidase n=1 Tax=termite gut metagenome TaxID=433724 RepID=A0A5J4RQN4_9ZZZZ